VRSFRRPDDDLRSGDETASSEARNSAAFAGVPPSPSIPTDALPALARGASQRRLRRRCFARRASTMGVCSWPGTTVFTRIPRAAYCTADDSRELDHRGLLARKRPAHYR